MWYLIPLLWVLFAGFYWRQTEAAQRYALGTGLPGLHLRHAIKKKLP